jgi:hypothetical protein
MLGRRFFMNTTKSSETGFMHRTPRQKQFFRIQGGAGDTGNNIRPAFMDQADHEIPDRFGEKFRLTGIDSSPEDTHEIKVLEQFLGGHVQQNQICEVPCMLLWNEWVRTFQRRTPGFPKLIREKEFRTVITENFGIKIVSTGTRGEVYPGIKFVP